MQRFFAWSSAAAIAILLVIVAGAALLVAFKRSQDANADAVCVAEVANADPRRDAETDIRNGEDRFYFLSHGGEIQTETADGLPPAPSQYGHDCESDGILANRRPPAFGRLKALRHAAGGFCCDIDVPRTSCGRAIDEYSVRYNREMARLSPSSIEKYCH